MEIEKKFKNKLKIFGYAPIVYINQTSHIDFAYAP